MIAVAGALTVTEIGGAGGSTVCVGPGCGVVGGAVCFVPGRVAVAAHVSVYVAGLEAVVTGLVTTRTAVRSPTRPAG